ncbi:MAG: DUF1858 domain-containing protein [archaeon]
MSKKTKITKTKKISNKTKFSEILQEKPGAAEILMERGMHCIGCPMSMQETLEQGCKAHGMTDKEIKKVVDELNK